MRLPTDCNGRFQAIATLRVGYLNRLAAIYGGRCFSGTPRNCGNRPKTWVFSQTGQTGQVKAPVAASLSFAAGVLPQALDDLV